MGISRISFLILSGILAALCVPVPADDHAQSHLEDELRIRSLVRMAVTYQGLGQVSRAFPRLQEAKQLAERHPDKALYAGVLGTLSDAYLVSRQLASALDHAQESVAVARDCADDAILATSLNYLGNVYFAQDGYREALQAYSEGVTLVEDNPELLVKLLINSTHAHLALDSSKTAKSLLHQSFELIYSFSDTREKAYHLISVGYLVHRLAKKQPINSAALLELAYQSYLEASRLAETMQDERAKSFTQGHLGELYAFEQRYDEAEQLFLQAISWAERISAPELLARWHWRLGRVRKTKGDIEQAEVAYRAAVQYLEDIKPALVFGQRGDTRTFVEEIRAVYLELADLLLTKSEDATIKEERLTGMQAARQVMEEYKAVELQNYYRDECVTEQPISHAKVNLETRLSPGTAVLYPIVFSDRIELLLALPYGEFRKGTAAVSATEILQTTVSFRQQIARLGNPRRLRKLGWSLYKWLIQPVEIELQNHAVDTLIIVPDYTLGTIPFSALYDGQDFLINRYALAFAPGLTMTAHTPVSTRDYRLLLAGLSKPREGFGGLKHVPKEIENTAKLYESSTLLLDHEFRKKEVRNALERSSHSAILFATHGAFTDDPTKSFLLTHDGKIRLDMLDSFIRIGQFRDQPLDLIVLSACNTAAGDERAALGLAGVAIRAGVNSVVASLWAVADESTADLVPNFFELLRDPKLSKAQALQRAQLQMLKNPSYRHPYHWAPLVLIGNWQ
ncbi:MAG: CHAT domain-containing protein [Pseudomonadota bacterium]